MDFLFESFGDNFLLCFSGQGDFFAGGKLSNQTEHLLQYNVRVYLDFNGALVNELFEIEPILLDKVLHFDVSFHYETMLEKGVLETWADNTCTLSQTIDASKWDVKGVVAMSNIEQLKEKLDYYAKKIYPITKKQLYLTLDDFDNAIYSSPVIKFINSTIARYPEGIRQSVFQPKEGNQKTNEQVNITATDKELFCPAGSLFFKVKLDGDVLPCNKLGNDHHIKIGNLKARKLSFLTQLIPCVQLVGPGCLANWDERYPQY